MLRIDSFWYIFTCIHHRSLRRHYHNFCLSVKSAWGHVIVHDSQETGEPLHYTFSPVVCMHKERLLKTVSRFFFLWRSLKSYCIFYKLFIQHFCRRTDTRLLRCFPQKLHSAYLPYFDPLCFDGDNTLRSEMAYMRRKGCHRNKPNELRIIILLCSCCK